MTQTTQTSLITLNQPDASGAEAFRTLRTQLHFASLEQPIGALLVASPDSAEAAAATVANLAVVSAQIGKRVIAVDANLRAPSLHTLLGLQQDAGLIEALRGGAPNLRATSVTGLRLLGTGTAPAIASDIIAAPGLSALLRSLTQDADLVLINAAPTADFSDAPLLASMSDAALLVAETNKTRRDQLQGARDAMQRAKARLLGVVMLG
jgi:capsular exopolysaccharide synthesis family protein